VQKVPLDGPFSTEKAVAAFASRPEFNSPRRRGLGPRNQVEAALGPALLPGHPFAAAFAFEAW
jgi:hypothetical protein